MQQQIVFLDRAAIQGKLRRPAFDHLWREYPRTAADDVSARLSEATIAILNRTPISASTLDRAPQLRLIAVAGTGVDSVDLGACRSRQVTVCNVRDWSTTSVAEHAFAMLLALRRGLFTASEAVRNGAWQNADHYCIMPERFPRRLAGSTLGVIGYGAIGRALAQRGRAFEMNVLVAERKDAREVRAGRRAFDEVLRVADALIVAAPLSDHTRGMIGRDEIAQAQSHAILINVSRGGIVDERALADAVIGGQIAGVAVDVLEHEPPREGNPLLDLQGPQVLITPHVAWLTHESLADLREQVIRNIELFVSGTPHNLV